MPTWNDYPGEAKLLFEAEAAAAAGLTPRLTCPSCGSLATDVSAGSEAYRAAAGIPPCPVGGLELPTVRHEVGPCGCRVDAYWAAAFSVEMESRLDGNPARPLAGVAAAREARLEHYTDRLSRLYALQQQDTTKAEKEAVDYWIVICCDQLQRLAPGAHNRKPPPKALTGSVAAWAKANGHAAPPVPALSDATVAASVAAASAGIINIDRLFRLLELPPSGGQPPPVPAEPAKVAAPEPAPAVVPPKPAVERHVKKKRTIRRIDD